MLKGKVASTILHLDSQNVTCAKIDTVPKIVTCAKISLGVTML